ncbi:MAG: class I adenylate-forming enzyme family protein [Pseudomonadales bacterium]|jgi:long-chain acyl-CoA synthetase|nr:class I adenylate-forming enzyme family protein [Pseudomonadales bacterium]MDG1444583.1 class I adenylate-forming enzyme family protein [Pseudomonadales bacterium]
MYKALRETWDKMISAGEQFEITEIEVRGETIKAYANAPPSLREVWQASALFADRDYLVYQDERWTYADAHRDVAAIAAWFGTQGIKSGDRVALALRNYPEWLLCYWAAVSQGITVVGMNAWWIGEEMRFALEDSTPKLLICDQERLDRFNEIRTDFAELPVVGVRTNDGADVQPFSVMTETAAELPEASFDPDTDACIFYTSGTTGRPKGAQLTHRGCVNNIMNLAFAGAAFGAATAINNGVALPDPADAPIGSALVTTPLFHVTANNCLTHGTTLTGGKLVHMYRWDALEALKIIEAEKITNMTGVPVMSRELIGHPDFEKYDTSTLLSVGGGGAQLQPDLVAKIDNAVKTARPSTGYGMTETCGIITSISGDFFIDKPDSCGPAMPNFSAKCIDANGNEVPQGQVGELLVKGAPVIKGYLNREEATAESITNGWLHTGDVARIDEHGFIFIVDRVKDMVLRGGENIYCAEVESVIFDQEGVAECSVFGVEDDRLGEEVGVAIVTKAGSGLTADAIREHALANMSKPKVPRYIWMLTESLPRNANGKFLKRELRDTLKIEDAL